MGIARWLQPSDMLVFTNHSSASPEANCFGAIRLEGLTKVTSSHPTIETIYAFIDENIDTVYFMSWEFFLLALPQDSLDYTRDGAECTLLNTSLSVSRAAIFRKHVIGDLHSSSLWPTRTVLEAMDELCEMRRCLDPSVAEALPAFRVETEMRELASLTVPPEFRLRTRGDYQHCQLYSEDVTTSPESYGDVDVCSIIFTAGYSGGEESYLQTFSQLHTKGLNCLVICRRSTLLSERLKQSGLNVTTMESIPSLHYQEFNHILTLLKLVRPKCIHFNAPVPIWLYHVASTLGIPIVQHWRISNCLDHSIEAKLVNAHICVSHFVASRLLQTGIDHRKLFVVNNGVNSIALAQGDRTRGLFVCLSRLSPSKNLEFLIEGFGRFTKLRPNARCEIYGEAAPQDRHYYKRLVDFINKANLATVVTIHDFDLKARELLLRAEAMILPSKSEPLSRSILEAMASGCLVAASNDGGTPEIISDSLDGFMFDLTDPERLTEVLHRIMDLSDDERTRLSNNARNTIANRFGLHSAIEGTHRVFNSLLEA